MKHQLVQGVPASQCTVTAGGHLNPAVTLGFVLTAKISIPRAFFYIIFQCLGACTGSALVKAVSGVIVTQLDAPLRAASSGRLPAPDDQARDQVSSIASVLTAHWRLGPDAILQCLPT